MAAAVVASVNAPRLDQNNIINVRDGESLYQICIKLRRRLSGVPGFQPYLDEIEEREAEGADPVSSLWQCFRSGLPLLAIYNASEPEAGELKVDLSQPQRVPKQAAFLFIKECMHQMKIPVDETFTISDLYSDNTSGFLKVTKLVNKVLDILHLSGKLHSADSEDSADATAGGGGPANRAKPKSRRDHILRELVDTERHYVHHLQNLQTLKKELEEGGTLTGDAIHNIFLNLNNLLDFAQRFLIRIEQQYELPESDQNWGQLFVRYKEPFRQYEPFIANQRRCEVTCTKEWDKMCATARSSLAKEILAGPTILMSFLLKPFQRLTKYPLLLKDLQKQTLDEELRADTETAINIIQDVLHQANASIDKETRDDAQQDLLERIEDWKSLALNTMGELLLLGTFMVMKDSGPLRSEEKEYHIYLFSRILVMCKDVNATKQRKKNLKVVSVRGKPMMHIKGRIYFTNVTQAQAHSAPPNYTLQIQWKGEKNDPNNEMFTIKFKNDETLQKWHQMIQTQRSASLLERNNSASVSRTQLISMAGVTLENPYANQAGEDEEEEYSRMSSSTTYAPSDYGMSRNASSNSLRSRSTTGGSSIHMPARLNTNVAAHSPGAYHPGNSYFSPIDRDSPPQSASIRSSSQSAFSGFGRNPSLGSGVGSIGSIGAISSGGVGGGSGGYAENYRNTAPAMGRNNAHPSGNPYLANQRVPHKPSLPPGAVSEANRNRMRSASSPDIHPGVQRGKPAASAENGVPNVPPIPAHVSAQMVNRSSSNSPGMSIPLRTSTPQSHDHAMAAASSHHANSHNSYESSSRSHTTIQSASTDRNSPPLSTPSSETDAFMPSQLRAKIRFDDNYVSMIIPSNIRFASLIERIDAKLARFTNHSIFTGSVKLRYRDEEGDFIWIDSDEAVQDALLDWREQHADIKMAGHQQHPELLLFAHSTEGQPVLKHG